MLTQNALQVRACGCRSAAGVNDLDKICVWADFDFLREKELIGTLFCGMVRGNAHFSFEYSPEWLVRHGSITLGGDMRNGAGRQYPADGEEIFSFIRDTFPDRWGRLLLLCRMRLRAHDSSVSKMNAISFETLLGTDEFSRMGGIIWRNEGSADRAGSQAQCAVPSVKSLSALCDASLSVEAAYEKNAQPSCEALDALALSACSLGGARPKASVIDTEGRLCVAKFPSVKDKEDNELLEHFAHLMARKAGISTAETSVIAVKRKRHVLLSRRFDRTSDGRRRHFASSMALLGLRDGDGTATGKGYPDIADFIAAHCVNPEQNLRELYRRIAFNILFGNTDDHFRNHGFLLTLDGWTLSPVYDLNPSHGRSQRLLINDETDVSDIGALLDSSERYLIERDEAAGIIREVKDALHDWQKVATENQIPLKIIDPYAHRFSC